MEVAAGAGVGVSAGVWFDFNLELLSGGLLAACSAITPD
jgi:hypothetical protein